MFGATPGPAFRSAPVQAGGPGRRKPSPGRRASGGALAARWTTSRLGTAPGSVGLTGSEADSHRRLALRKGGIAVAALVLCRVRIPWQASADILCDMLRKQGLDPDRIESPESAWQVFCAFL